MPSPEIWKTWVHAHAAHLYASDRHEYLEYCNCVSTVTRKPESEGGCGVTDPELAWIDHYYFARHWVYVWAGVGATAGVAALPVAPIVAPVIGIVAGAGVGTYTLPPMTAMWDSLKVVARFFGKEPPLTHEGGTASAPSGRNRDWVKKGIEDAIAHDLTSILDFRPWWVIMNRHPRVAIHRRPSA